MAEQTIHAHRSIELLIKQINFGAAITQVAGGTQTFRAEELATNITADVRV